MLPLQNTVEDVKSLVEKVKFPPIGNRGIDAAGVDAAFGEYSWGKDEHSMASYVQWAAPSFPAPPFPWTHVLPKTLPNELSRHTLKRWISIVLCSLLTSFERVTCRAGAPTVRRSSPSKSRRGPRSQTAKRWRKWKGLTSSSLGRATSVGGCRKRGALSPLQHIHVILKVYSHEPRCATQWERARRRELFRWRGRRSHCQGKASKLPYERAQVKRGGTRRSLRHFRWRRQHVRGQGVLNRLRLPRPQIEGHILIHVLFEAPVSLPIAHSCSLEVVKIKRIV